MAFKDIEKKRAYNIKALAQQRLRYATNAEVRARKIAIKAEWRRLNPDKWKAQCQAQYERGKERERLLSLEKPLLCGFPKRPDSAQLDQLIVCNSSDHIQRIAWLILIRNQDEAWKKGAALRAYYANHELGKARSRANAKKVWERNKSNPEWRKRKLQRTREIAFKRRRMLGVPLRPKLTADEKRIRERERNRRKNQKRNHKPERKIVRNLRKRLRDFVHSSSVNRKDMIGCSPIQLRKHIESQWLKWMTWENYGTRWVIDHIIPCASFDLTKRSEVMICFNWQNLRPLCEIKNRIKSDTIEDAQQPLALCL
jgi:hypothetical protein